MSEVTSDGFNFAEVDAKKMKVRVRGREQLVDGKVVVADNKAAYGGDAKTIALMAAETVARVTQDGEQAERAYEQALEQAEQDPRARMLYQRTKSWQVKNRIADATLEYDPAQSVWYLRYLKVDKQTGFATMRYRILTDEEMDRLGEKLTDMGVEV